MAMPAADAVVPSGRAQQTPAGPARQPGERLQAVVTALTAAGVLSLRSLAAASLARISLTPGAARPGRGLIVVVHGQVRASSPPGALAGIHDALAVGQFVRAGRRAGTCARGP